MLPDIVNSTSSTQETITSPTYNLFSNNSTTSSLTDNIKNEQDDYKILQSLLISDDSNLFNLDELSHLDLNLSNNQF